MITPLPDFKVLTIEPGYDLQYLASFLPLSEATKWFERLLAGTPWATEVVNLLPSTLPPNAENTPKARAARNW